MHPMHILLYKLRIVTIIFHPQLTIQEKSVIMKKKNVFLFTQAWPTHSSDYLGHEIVTIILIVTKTIMITMSMTKRGQWDWRKAVGITSDLACSSCSGCWAKFVWTWQEKSWIQVGRTIIFLACFCKQICLTVVCLKCDNWTSFTCRLLNQFTWFT